jgi:hypothetical protein
MSSYTAAEYNQVTNILMFVYLAISTWGLLFRSFAIGGLFTVGFVGMIFFQMEKHYSPTEILAQTAVMPIVIALVIGTLLGVLYLESFVEDICEQIFNFTPSVEARKMDDEKTRLNRFVMNNGLVAIVYSFFPTTQDPKLSNDRMTADPS